MMPVSLVEDPVDTCQRLEELRDQHNDLLQEAKACAKLVVEGPPREPLNTLLKANSPEDLRVLVLPHPSLSFNS